MYQITIEIPEETVVNGVSNVLSFKSTKYNDVDIAWSIFDKTRDTVHALNMKDVYVNMFDNGQLVAWYRI